MSRSVLFPVLMIAAFLALSGAAQVKMIAVDPALDVIDLSNRIAAPLPDPVAEFTAYRAELLVGFWRYQALLATVFLFGSYILGRQVIRRGWKVGYTRKANALMLYFLPYVALHGPSPYSNVVTASISLGVFLVLLMSMSAPIRTRVPALATAFASIDRPEDRPLTLTWLITSVLAVWGVVILWIWFAPASLIYVFVAFFISGVGDALAEPVGLFFGKHTYRTTALFTDKTYIRTLEGSAVVFASGVIAVLIVHGLSLDLRGLLALALFPIVGTLAEAKSPHTWDQPFIIASCALVAVGLSLI